MRASSQTCGRPFLHMVPTWESSLIGHPSAIRWPSETLCTSPSLEFGCQRTSAPRAAAVTSSAVSQIERPSDSISWSCCAARRPGRAPLCRRAPRLAAASSRRRPAPRAGTNCLWGHPLARSRARPGPPLRRNAQGAEGALEAGHRSHRDPRFRLPVVEVDDAFFGRPLHQREPLGVVELRGLGLRSVAGTRGGNERVARAGPSPEDHFVGA